MKTRKLSFFIVLFWFCIFCHAKTFKVISFNIGTNSSRHRANDKEWINSIAEIIKESDADIIFLQEAPILSDSDIRGEFLRVLKDTLLTIQPNKKWQSLSTFSYLRNKVVVNRKPSYTLNNAVLYNSEVFISLLNGHYPINFEDGTTFYNYQSRFNNIQVIQFAFKDEISKRFLGINVHTYYGDPSSDLEIVGNIIRDYCNEQSYIIAGDFNMSIGWINSVILNYGNRKIYIDGNNNPDGNYGLKTSISKKSDNNQLFLLNDYDHFLYSGKIKNVDIIHHVFSNMSLDFYPENSIKIGEKYYNNAKNNFRSDISDHMPIVMTFDYEEN